LYDGGVIAVELDGHDWHKTKEQRGKDASKQNWLAARKITTVRFTGSQVFADPQRLYGADHGHRPQHASSTLTACSVRRKAASDAASR
jgi:hypothetical protein